MGRFTVRTPAGTGKSLAVFEHKTALETFARSDGNYSSLGRQRPGDMVQMLIYFFLLNS